mgnify:CR=1 FL=1
MDGLLQLLGNKIVYHSQRIVQIPQIAAAALVGANSTSLISACGENSFVPLLLLSPPDPLRWAPAGAPRGSSAPAYFSSTFFRY